MKHKGFTLIELLVVVSIISLLTSVVLSSLKDARDRAKGTAFRQEIRELIKAIELYRSSNPNLLFLNTTNQFYRMNSNGSIASGGPWVDIGPKLNPYIKKMPVPPSLYYEVVRDTYNCVGDNVTDASSYYYLILISGSENIKYFQDWKDTRRGTTLQSNKKCFSWK